jgi:hypothetical protein
VPDKVVPDRGSGRPNTIKIKPTKAVPTEIKPPVTDNPKVVTPEVKPTQTAPTAAMVANQWQKVGEQLKALGPGQDDMWNRWRRININEAMKDPAKLAQAADILAKLSRELAAIKK